MTEVHAHTPLDALADPLAPGNPLEQKWPGWASVSFILSSSAALWALIILAFLTVARAIGG